MKPKKKCFISQASYTSFGVSPIFWSLPSNKICRCPQTWHLFVRLLHRHSHISFSRAIYSRLEAENSLWRLNPYRIGCNGTTLILLHWILLKQLRTCVPLHFVLSEWDAFVANHPGTGPISWQIIRHWLILLTSFVVYSPVERLFVSFQCIMLNPYFGKRCINLVLIPVEQRQIPIRSCHRIFFIQFNCWQKLHLSYR